MNCSNKHVENIHKYVPLNFAWYLTIDRIRTVHIHTYMFMWQMCMCCKNCICLRDYKFSNVLKKHPKYELNIFHTYVYKCVCVCVFIYKSTFQLCAQLLTQTLIVHTHLYCYLVDMNCQLLYLLIMSITIITFNQCSTNYWFFHTQLL